MKSPIQLKNKRSNASPILKKLIPPESVVDSFLFFSGEMELELMKHNCFLVAHTNSYGVYEFWRCLQTDPLRLGEIAEYYSRMFVEDPKMFYWMQEKWMERKDPFVRSAYFFLLSFYSDLGRVSTGAYVGRDDNSLHFAITRLKTLSLKNFHIKFDEGEDYLQGVTDVSAPDYVLFPVGDYSFNYFEEGVGLGFEDTRIYHKKLKQFFDASPHKTILLYRKHSELFRLYRQENMTLLDQYGRETQDRKKCTEVIIANF